jgi:hypothetical protein
VPALPPEDPRSGLNLARPDVSDNFSTRYTWGEPESDGVENLWEDGRLRATDKLADPFIWWSTTFREAGDVYVEVTAEVGECSGKDGYGLAIRVSGDNMDSGYTLEFSCDGFYRLRSFSGGSVKTLLDWRPAEAIRSGSNTSNRMGFLAKAGKLYAVANGDLLGSAVEDLDHTYGTFGLFARAAETPGLTVYFDDFALWYLSP